VILDVRTVFIITFLYGLLTGAGLVFASRSYSGTLRRSMNVMGAGAVFLMSGVLAAGLQGIWLTSFSSVLLANLLMLWGAGEYYQALRLFDGEETSRSFTLMIAAGVTGVNLFFYAAAPSLSTRVTVMSLAFSFLMGLSGARILRSRSVSGSTVRNTASFSFWLVSILFLARAVGTVFFGWYSRTLMESNLWQTLLFSGSAVGFVLINFSYLLLCNGQFNRHLEQLALTDPLTGLFNRRAFSDLALREIARSARSGEPLSLIMIDADGFKKINDTFGHAAGDRVLQHLSVLIRDSVRPQDVVGRLGGDEFAVLLPGANHIMALGVEERLVAAVDEHPLSWHEGKIPLRISAGTAALNLGDPDFDDLLSRADDALYRAKGHNRK
jgi:diguanylate cyclase (GGDEF)-like protein